MREIVSRQYRHAGGIARVEQDAAGHLLVTCSGACQMEEYRAGMAPALALLVDHVGEPAEEVSD